MKGKALPLVMSMFLATTCVTPVAAKTAENPKNIKVKNQLSENGKQKVLEKMDKQSKGKLKARFLKEKGKGTKVFLLGDLSEKIKTNGASALTYLESNKDLFGLDNIISNFQVAEVNKDNIGFTHIKLRQIYNGLPIEGRELILHVDKNGVVKGINGNYQENIIELKDKKESKNKSKAKAKSKEISKDNAIAAAISQFNYDELRNEPKAERVSYIMNDELYDAYKVNVVYNTPEIGNWDVYVDINSGDVINKLSNIRYQSTTGTGTAVDGSTKTLDLDLSSGRYYMDSTANPSNSEIKTYTANNAQTQPGSLVYNTTNTFNSEIFKAAVSAHYNADVVFDFYHNVFGRDSLDNNGMDLISTVHYGSSYNNAFWDGTQMVYGDGDGSTFTYLSGDLDVVAHEMTHGVTSKTANLAYQDQSGALNESFSDIFGVLAETYDKYNVKNGGSWQFNSGDWVVGDDVYTPNRSGDALRSLANPTLYNQPDNMANYVNTSSDNGGVHTNSGIPNKAGYLVAKSLGCEKTANIYYRALTQYLTSYSDFQDTRDALVQSAQDLYGTTEANAVGNAFDSVGIGGSSSSSDPYEPNDSRSSAYPISSGVTYNSYISTSSDYDYYKISKSRSGYIDATLTNLPKDYDLYLLDVNGNILARSENGSTSTESLSYYASSGTYYVVVLGYNGYYSTTTKYALRADF